MENATNFFIGFVRCLFHIFPLIGHLHKVCLKVGMHLFASERQQKRLQLLLKKNFNKRKLWKKYLHYLRIQAYD